MNNFVIRAMNGQLSARRVGTGDNKPINNCIGINGTQYERPAERMSNRALYMHLCNDGVVLGACERCQGCRFGEVWAARDKAGKIDYNDMRKWSMCRC